MRIRAEVGEKTIDIVVQRENGHYVVEIDGNRHEVDARKLDGDSYSFLTNGRSYDVAVEPAGDGYRVRHGAAQREVRFSDPSRRARQGFGAGDGPVEITSAMPGKVVRVLVNEGDEVEAGQGVMVVEAMKMENEIESPKAGKVASIAVQPGETVESGGLLVVVE